MANPSFPSCCSSIGKGSACTGALEPLVQSQGLLPGQDDSWHPISDRLPCRLPRHCLPHDQSTDGFRPFCNAFGCDSGHFVGCTRNWTPRRCRLLHPSKFHFFSVYYFFINRLIEWNRWPCSPVRPFASLSSCSLVSSSILRPFRITWDGSRGSATCATRSKVQWSQSTATIDLRFLARKLSVPSLTHLNSWSNSTWPTVATSGLYLVCLLVSSSFVWQVISSFISNCDIYALNVFKSSIPVFVWLISFLFKTF